MARSRPKNEKHHLSGIPKGEWDERLHANTRQYGATIWTRDDGNNTEFLVVSYWESMDAIRKFSGEDTLKARYYPEDTEFLLEPEASVKHYRVAFEL